MANTSRRKRKASATDANTPIKKARPSPETAPAPSLLRQPFKPPFSRPPPLQLAPSQFSPPESASSQSAPARPPPSKYLPSKRPLLKPSPSRPPSRKVHVGCNNGLEASRIGDWSSEYASIRLTNVHPKCGSWRSIQLTDPPCEEISIVTAQATITSSSCRRVVEVPSSEKLRAPGGVTMGSLVDVLYVLPNTTLWVAETPRSSLRQARVDERMNVNRISKKFQDEEGTGDLLESLRMEVKLVGVLLPSSEEWAAMEEKSVLA